MTKLKALNLSLTDRKANILEGIGLTFILFSFFLQLAETNIENDTREAEIYQTQVKLDRLWMVISQEYSEKHPDLNVSGAINFNAINKEWKYYSQDKDDLKSWKKNVLFEEISNYRIWIFTLGSILILIPKFTRRIRP